MFITIFLRNIYDHRAVILSTFVIFISKGALTMKSEQCKALDEILVRMRAGRMKRRTFLENALALGFTSSVAESVLAACGGSSNSSGGNRAAINVTWQGEYDTAGI